MTPFIRIISQPQKYIKAGGGPVNARPPVLQRFFIVPKSWTKNRCLTPGPGSRAANVVNLHFAVPVHGRQVENLLSVYFILSKRFKKSLVLKTLENNEVYHDRPRWFFTQMTEKGKINPREIEVSILLPSICVEIIGAGFFSRQLSQFFPYRHNNVPTIFTTGGCLLSAPALFFLPGLLNFACANTPTGACQQLQVKLYPAGADGPDHLSRFMIRKAIGTGPAFLWFTGIPFPCPGIMLYEMLLTSFAFCLSNAGTDNLTGFMILLLFSHRLFVILKETGVVGDGIEVFYLSFLEAFSPGLCFVFLTARDSMDYTILITRGGELEGIYHVHKRMLESDFRAHRQLRYGGVCVLLHFFNFDVRLGAQFDHPVEFRF